MSTREKMVARRRRALVLALTAAAFVVSALQGDDGRQPTAVAKRPSPAPRVATSSPVPSTAATPPSQSPVPSPSASPSASPSPTPKGPPFVIDAAGSCAGRTALIDIQVAASPKRPIVKLELLLDGKATALTPVPSYPLRGYAGRSSGQASAAGAGGWIVRATDREGIAEERMFPYACS